MGTSLVNFPSKVQDKQSRMAFRLLALLFSGTLQASTAIPSIGRSADESMEVVGRSLETTTSSSALGDTWWVEIAHEDSDCSDAPAFGIAINDCAAIQSNNDASSGCYQRASQKNSSLQASASIVRYSNDCTDSLTAYLNTLFGDTAYLRIDFYDAADCSGSYYSNFHPADGACHSMVLGTGSTESPTLIRSFLTTIQENGSISRKTFGTSGCSGDPDEMLELSASQLAEGKCSSSTIITTNAAGISAGSTQETSDTSSASPSFRAEVITLLMVLLVSMTW